MCTKIAEELTCRLGIVYTKFRSQTCWSQWHKEYL